MSTRTVRHLFALVALLTVGRALANGDSDTITAFVGEANCRKCHTGGEGAAACTVETVPEHARAFDALSKSEARHIAVLSGISARPADSLLCLSCHATGAEEGPRWWRDGFRPDDGVQCEACHGPGSIHVGQMRARAGWTTQEGHARIRRGSREECKHCHFERASHDEVLIRGFRLTPADAQYRTPVNLAVSADGARLYVVNEQADSLSIVNPAEGKVLAEVRVGHRPHGVAVGRDGAYVFVTNRMSDSVSVVDVHGGGVIAQIAVGHDPHGIVIDPSGDHAFVANTGDDTISVVDLRIREEVHRLVGGAGPWSVALSSDGMTCVATNVRPDPAVFREPAHSELTLVDVQRRVVSRRHTVADANMLQGVTGVPGRNIALFVMNRSKNLVPSTRVAQGWVITNALGVLRDDGRIDQVLLDAPNEYFADPMDVAVSRDGRHALVTSGGTNRVAVIDIDKLLGLVESFSDVQRLRDLPNHLGSSDRFVLKRVPVGVNPRGVVFAPDGRHAYVANALDDSITVLDGHSFESVRTIALGGPQVVSEIRRGERLFHDAAVTFGQQFSCRSCHPDGHVNGLTFDIEADGLGVHPVDNRSLRGILDTAPFKWEGTNPSLFRQCGPRFAVFFTRLAPYAPNDLAALVRYMCTIELPPNRFRQSNGLTSAQRRGKDVFQRIEMNDGTPLRPEQRCNGCHNSAFRTNRQTVSVATTMWFDTYVPVPIDEMFNTDEFGALGTYYFIDAGMPAVAFDVPHLTNIADGGPYLHNGAATTLEEIWTRFNMVNRHGMTDDLTRQQLNDLVAYLKSW